jgi:sulfur carrier protein ThiS
MLLPDTAVLQQINREYISLIFSIERKRYAKVEILCAQSASVVLLKDCKKNCTKKTINQFNERKITMRILFINNNGSGYADYVNIAENTTIDQFFAIKMQGEQTSDYLIRVNRQPVPKDYVLCDGDRVTITPVKIEGAIC